MVGSEAGSSEGNDISPGEWEAEDIIGEEVINGRIYYMFAWKPSLEPKSHARNAEELIKKWEAKKATIQAQRGKSRGSSGTKRKGAAVKGQGKVEKTGSTGGKRGLGRPHKN